MDNTFPPLPDGATLDQPPNGLPPLPPGATLDTPATTTVAKTSEGPAMAPPPSFKAAPASPKDDPAHFTRFLNGMVSGLTGTGQLGTHLTEEAGKGNPYARAALRILLPAGLGEGAIQAAAYAPETVHAASAGMDSEARQLAEDERRLAAGAGLAPGDTDWYNIAGQVANPANYVPGGVGAKAARAVPTVGRFLAGRGILPAAAEGAIQGAGIGLTEPVTSGDYWGEKAGQTATGAVTGGIGAPIVNKIGAAVKPAIAEAAQTLINHGFNPYKFSVGQLAGGTFDTTEQHLQKVPVIGDMIAAQRQKSAKELQRVAGNEALGPTGLTLNPGVEAGPDMMQNLADQRAVAYTQAHAPMTLRSTPEFTRANEAIYNDAVKRKLPPEKLAILRDAIDGTINGQLDVKGIPIKGENIQSITSTLSNDAHGLSLAQGDYWASRTSQFLKRLQENTEKLMLDQNPGAFQAWKNAQKMNPMYKTIEAAAGMAGGPEAQYSPGQLFRASQKNKPADVKATATGPLSELAAAAKKIIPTAVPNSGTPTGYALLHMLGLGAGAHAVGIPTGAIAPLAALAGFYSPVGQNLTKRYMLAFPENRQVLRNILERYAPVAGAQAQIVRGQGQ